MKSFKPNCARSPRDVDRFWLAIGLVDEHNHADGPYYLQNPFTQEPDFGIASVNYDLKDLLSRATRYYLQ